MRKKLAVLFSLILATLISMLMISPVQADIERFYWLPPFIKKEWDGNYGAYVVVYRHGSTARLKVGVKNHLYSNGLNVSKVIISFDWDQNKTLDLSANINQVGFDETEYFTVSFTADATEAVTSEWAHTYTIYVEHVNATTGPTGIVGTWSRLWTYMSPAYKFVVFPADQADALELYTELSAVFAVAPEFDTAKGKALWSEAASQRSLGMSYYESGRFAEANATLHTASDLVDQAFEAEDERGSKLENAMINYYNAAVTESYAWLLFGLGIVLIGIGAIIYAVKKPKAAKAA